MPEPEHRALRALVLEDEWPARNYLVQLIERSGLGHVVAAVPSTVLATEALGSSPQLIDVAFVDVHLAGARSPERAGLSWIEETVRARGERAPRFVLSTARDDHAMKAFELGVVDYLLKPFTEARVKRALERLAASPRAPEPSADVRIAARDGRAIVFLRREEAFAFEADGRLCYVHSSRGRLDVDLSLTSLESVLGAGYLRVHRSWLVSLDHVRSIERDGDAATLLVGHADPPIRVNVARDRTGAVRERLLSRAVGLRGDRG
ncbi:MAG: response regulator transcription factor [Labilithrix sp.]|nr:response regulator transcription factor [Labilithrix sp.]MCW5816254.1 response regulator transcription factor [Labilithrix sp.]